MSNTYKLMAAAVLTFGLIFFASQSSAGDKDKVQKFYDFLSNPASKEHAQKFSDVTTKDWVSVGNYSGKNKSKEAFLGQINGFSKLIPDLNWNVQSITQKDNLVTVRSRATGTPKGPFFGVDGEGRKFDIMTIDIHEINDGKISRTYHVEDWAGALQQLKGDTITKADQTKASLKIVQDFMGAMGSGDMAKMSELMANDMVWHNEGDSRLPWIGPWQGKEAILGFLKVFSENVQTTKWENEDMFASGDTVAAFGKMKLLTTKSGKETADFTFALRIKVKDGKIALWNWFEDSYAVSKAYNAN